MSQHRIITENDVKRQIAGLNNVLRKASTPETGIASQIRPISYSGIGAY